MNSTFLFLNDRVREEHGQCNQPLKDVCVSSTTKYTSKVGVLLA